MCVHTLDLFNSSRLASSSCAYTKSLVGSQRLSAKASVDIMDLFAEALAETVFSCGDSQRSSEQTDSVLSQDIDSGHTDSQFSECPESDVILLSDDADESSPCTDSPPADGLSAEPSSSTSKRKTSGCPDASKAFVPKSKRPKGHSYEAAIKLTPYTAITDFREVLCFVVQRKKCPVVVPLWSQYTASWKSVDMPDKWIVVSNYERWIQQLVDAVTIKCVRTISKQFTDKLKTEFVTCLWKARRPSSLDDPFEDKTLIKDQLIKNYKATDAALVIQIGGHSVTCLNNASRMVLKLDNATAKFISDWVVPFVTKVALCQALPLAPSNAVADGTLANFQLIASATPNLRDKVQWNPSNHIWEVVVKKPKSGHALDSSAFHVDPKLSPAAYEEEKTEAYRRAIMAWNSVDGSNRHRIALGQLAFDIN